MLRIFYLEVHYQINQIENNISKMRLIFGNCINMDGKLGIKTSASTSSGITENRITNMIDLFNKKMSIHVSHSYIKF